LLPFERQGDFKSGALGTVHSSRWATGHANREYLCVYGDKGAVEIDFEKGQAKLRYCENKTNEWKEIDCPATLNMQERFIAAIQTKKNDPSDFANGFLIQKVLAASEKSSRSGRPVAISK
jgi:predicted dehydrogenase